jgi:hypothetical protein
VGNILCYREGKSNHRLSLFEHKIPKGIFETKKEEAILGRNLYNKKLYTHAMIFWVDIV